MSNLKAVIHPGSKKGDSIRIEAIRPNGRSVSFWTHSSVDADIIAATINYCPDSANRMMSILDDLVIDSIISNSDRLRAVHLLFD